MEKKSEQEFISGDKVICINGPESLGDGIIGSKGVVRKYFKDANLYEVVFGIESWYLSPSELKSESS